MPSIELSNNMIREAAQKMNPSNVFSEDALKAWAKSRGLVPQTMIQPGELMYLPAPATALAAVAGENTRYALSMARVTRNADGTAFVDATDTRISARIRIKPVESTLRFPPIEHVVPKRKDSVPVCLGLPILVRLMAMMLSLQEESKVHPNVAIFPPDEEGRPCRFEIYLDNKTEAVGVMAQIINDRFPADELGL